MPRKHDSQSDTSVSQYLYKRTLELQAELNTLLTSLKCRNCPFSETVQLFDNFEAFRQQWERSLIDPMVKLMRAEQERAAGEHPLESSDHEESCLHSPPGEGLEVSNGSHGSSHDLTGGTNHSGKD